YKCCGHGTHAGHALGALGGKRSNNCHAIGAQGAHGLDIGQYAGAAGGIDSGDGKSVWDHVWTKTGIEQLALNSTILAEEDLRLASLDRRCKPCGACGLQGMPHVRPGRLSSWHWP